MTVSYKVVGSNGPHDALLDSTLTGELVEIYDNFYSFIVGEIDYDLEVQMRKTIDGKDYLFCWLTSEENCGRVALEIL